MKLIAATYNLQDGKVIKSESRRITYIRKVTMKKGRYLKEMFAEFTSLRIRCNTRFVQLSQ